MKQCQVLIFAFDHEECDSLSKKIKAALGTTCFLSMGALDEEIQTLLVFISQFAAPFAVENESVHRYTVLFHFDELDFGQEDRHDLSCLVWARCMFRFGSPKLGKQNILET